jgi:dihydrofolate reductase
MRRVVFEVSVSFDGFIEGPNGEMDWLVSDGGVFNVDEFFSTFDTMFFGRKAYEKLALPQVPLSMLTDEQRWFFYMLYGMRKYVFSRRARHVVGNGMVVNEPIVELVSRIRAEDGKDILFCGGAEIHSAFAELDLIDDYILTIHPVLLSSGKLLFKNNKTPDNLRLIRRENLSSGVVVLHYKPISRLINDSYDNRSFQDKCQER